METQTVTLTEFLLARIAEDEKAANHAGSHPENWGVMANDNYGHLLIQPHRVLAECEAKRRIVELHRPVEAAPCHCGKPHTPWMPPACETCGTGQIGGLCDTLRALASGYAEHPDYRDEWRP